MSGQPLPSVLKTDTVERPEVRGDVNTDLLFPVAFNQSQAKFVFDKKGILDSNSQLQLAATVKETNGSGDILNAFYPTSVGAPALIARAFLEIGGKRVSDLQDLAHYTTWKRLHFSNEYRKGIAMPKQAGSDVFMGSAARGIAPDSATAIKSRGFTAPYGTLGRSSSEFATRVSTNPVGEQTAARTDTIDRAKRLITTDENTTPTFTIGLSQLIPFLVGVQLPLFAIREEVSLHIIFNEPEADVAFCVPQAGAGGVPINKANCVSTIVEKKFLIMADYLFYPSMMAEIAEDIMARGGYDIPYLEILEQRNFTKYTTGGFTNDYQIQVGGKKVKFIVVQKEEQGLDANFGNYNSVALREGMTYNFKIDSNNVYSLGIANTALQKTEADAVEGIPLVLNNYIYTFKGQTDGAGVIASINDFGLTDRTYNSYSQTLESGSQAWVGLKLENAFGQGQRISNQPIIYSERGEVFAPDNNSTRNVRFWIGTQRLLNISSGIATILE
tara:strand:+ start:7681 stop:9180 length:1500 start_codon:yes stop_codon:yes gene_type:complete